MNDLDDDTIRGVVGEVIADQLKIIMECLDYLMPMRQDVEILKNDMIEVKSDIRAIKAIAREHSIQLDNHEGRLITLEGT
jgi:hypothetical protein